MKDEDQDFQLASGCLHSLPPSFIHLHSLRTYKDKYCCRAVELVVNKTKSLFHRTYILVRKESISKYKNVAGGGNCCGEKLSKKMESDGKCGD